VFGTCSLLFVLVWLVRDRFSNLEHDQREKTNYFEEIQDISQNKDALSVWATHVMAAACSQPLPVLVTGASTQLKLSLAGSCVAKVRENLYHCLLKFRSCSQVLGSFAHKIALGGFFSSLSSGLNPNSTNSSVQQNLRLDYILTP
jgi:hypothetical protein